MRRLTALVATVVPALLLAGLGCTHPAVLTPASAPWWRDLHVVGLVFFPLLALGPLAVVRGRAPRVLEALAVALGLVYASFYTALDCLAGIGAGELTVRIGPGPWVSTLFGIADQVVVPAVWSYLAATLLAAGVTVVTARGPARVVGGVGAVVALVAAWSFLSSHIYYPIGVVTMVGLAVGHGLMAHATHPVGTRPVRPAEPATAAA